MFSAPPRANHGQYRAHHAELMAASVGKFTVEGASVTPTPH